MKTPCVHLPPTLGDHEGTELDPVAVLGFEEHLRACPDCVETMKGILDQRATIRGAFGAVARPAALSGSTTTRMVNAMTRASGDARSARHAGGA